LLNISPRPLEKVIYFASYIVTHVDYELLSGSVARVQAVVQELYNEKIDVVRWSENITEYVRAALSPAKPTSVRITDAERKTILVVVPSSQLSLAIGKEGQNVRLAARLVGWKIDIRDEARLAQEAARADA
ncbi:MAG: KH domain-containing protein, partial [Armatimonadota bacterium]|nr:KH domain-containing protein [Armatimonadota bacterium]